MLSEGLRVGRDVCFKNELSEGSGDWIEEEKQHVGTQRSSEHQGIQVPGEAPIWAMTEQYRHGCRVVSASLS